MRWGLPLPLTLLLTAQAWQHCWILSQMAVPLQGQSMLCWHSGVHAPWRQASRFPTRHLQ